MSLFFTTLNPAKLALKAFLSYLIHMKITNTIKGSKFVKWTKDKKLGQAPILVFLTPSQVLSSHPSQTDGLTVSAIE